jgi:hypothetical protein
MSAMMMMPLCLNVMHLRLARRMIVRQSHRPAARRERRGCGEPNRKKRMEGANRMPHH